MTSYQKSSPGQQKFRWIIPFFEDYSKRHKTTISEIIDIFIRQLQQTEGDGELAAIEAELEEHTGIIPHDVDAKREYYEYIEEKHQ